MRFLPFLLLAAVPVLSLSSCQTPAAPDKPGSAFVAPGGRAGDLIHRDSDFHFPPQVAGLKRVRHTQYEQTGQEVSVTYTSEKPRVAALVFIYPRRGVSLEQEFARRGADVQGRHKGARVISNVADRVTPGREAALSAEFRYTGPLNGETQPLRSKLVLAQHKDWFVEYRFTYAAGTQAASEPLVRQFEDEFTWP